MRYHWDTPYSMFRKRCTQFTEPILTILFTNRSSRYKIQSGSIERAFIEYRQENKYERYC